MGNDKLGTIRKTAGDAFIKRIKSPYKSGSHINITNATKALKAKGVSNDDALLALKALRGKGTSGTYTHTKIEKVVKILKKANMLKIGHESVSLETRGVRHAVETALTEQEKEAIAKKMHEKGVLERSGYTKEERNKERDEKEKKEDALKNPEKTEHKNARPIEISHTATSIPKPSSPQSLHPSSPSLPSTAKFIHPELSQGSTHTLPSQILPPSAHVAPPPESPSIAA